MQTSQNKLWFKASTRVWFDKLKTTLISLDYKPAKSDTPLFTKFGRGTTTYILVYVNDLIIIGDNEKEINHVIRFLDGSFQLGIWADSFISRNRSL